MHVSYVLNHTNVRHEDKKIDPTSYMHHLKNDNIVQFVALEFIQIKCTAKQF